MNFFNKFARFFWSLLIMANQFNEVAPLLEDFNCNDIPSIQMCCQSSARVNETSIEVTYIVTRVNSSAGIDWGLSVNISWEYAKSNALTKFEVEWEKAITEEDLDGGEQLNGQRGSCFETTAPHPCNRNLENLVMVDQPYFSASDLLFGFQYRFRVRVLEDGNPAGLFICLSGHSFSDPSRFTSPDCYASTGDLDFCRSQPIIISSPPMNASVVETILQPESENGTLLTLRISWMPPVQLNGAIERYFVRSTTSSGDTVYSKIKFPFINETEDTIYEVVAPGFLNNTLYKFEITPTVMPARGSFFNNMAGQTAVFSLLTFAPHLPVNTTLTTNTPIRSTRIPPPPSTDSFLVFVIVIGVTVVIVVVCAAVIVKTMLKKRRSKTKRKEQSPYFKPQFGHRSSAKEEQCRRDAVDPEFKAVEIFDYDNIKEGTLLGSGQYGEVFNGEAILQGNTTWTVVAIKKPKNAISQEVIDDFKNEIRLMLELGKHPNIVSVLGCCTVEEPFYLLTDFMEYGDLLHFLRKCCKEGSTDLDPIYKITTINQLQIAQQIANGMNYVSHTRFFHGDLAARNILVGAGLVVKITDFGLTDDLYQKGYTRLQADAKRPYKWYSPESIEHQFCTLKTDIWSFGVLMWEISTFGQQTPYRGMSIQEVLFRLKDGYRMPCPEGTPAFMVKMINSCWQLDPEDRPSFGDLLETTNFLLERGTGDENYIIAEDDEVEPEAATENDNSSTRKKSLIQLLNIENIDPSEISGSSESALLGVSKVSSGCTSMQLNTITEDEKPTEEIV